MSPIAEAPSMRKLAFLAVFAVACGGSSETTEPAPADAPTAAPTDGAQAPADGDAPAPEGDAAADADGADDPHAEGKKLYQQYCIACHQGDGKGMNGTLAGDFTSGRLGEKSNEELLASIKNGYTGEVGAMPAWNGVLTDEQMKAVLDYIMGEFHPAG